MGPTRPDAYRRMHDDFALRKPQDFRKGVGADDGRNDVERFDLASANITAQDLERVEGDAEKHMRELLSGAIGEVDEAVGEGDDVVEGFSANVRLMPHQVRGTRWMRTRESGRKYGGVLADVSGDAAACLRCVYDV
jgi:hypothetical protein